MIYGHIDSAETLNAYTEKVRKAIAVLREMYVTEMYVTEMHHGKYPLNGDNIILQINEISAGP